MRYLDANFFVRGLTQDEPGMSRAALELFRRIEQGREDVRVLEASVAEVVYVLASRALYALPRSSIREHLGYLLSYRSVHMDSKARCLRALDLYASISSINFADALVAAAALEEAQPEVYSFDAGLDRVPGVRRVGM